MRFWNKNSNVEDQNVDMNDDLEAIYISPSRTNNKDDVYTIGIDLEGNTIMRLQLNQTTTTLTLTPYSVRKMIKLLEATLDDEDDSDYNNNEFTQG